MNPRPEGRMRIAWIGPPMGREGGVPEVGLTILGAMVDLGVCVDVFSTAAPSDDLQSSFAGTRWFVRSPAITTRAPAGRSAVMSQTLRQALWAVSRERLAAGIVQN